MSKKSKRYYVRKFLNKHQGKAFIEILGFRKGDGPPDLAIAISDCSRQVTLEFDVYGDSGDATIAGRLYKLDMIISELQKAREWISPPKTLDDN